MDISIWNAIRDRIKDNGGFTTEEITTEFGVDKRTLVRWLEYIRNEMDLDIQYNRKNKRYELLGPLGDWDDEEYTVILNSYMYSAIQCLPVSEKVAKNLKRLFTSKLSHKEQEALSKVEYQAPAIEIPEHKTFNTIYSALKNSWQLKVNYLKADGKESRDRVIFPLRLINYNASWYAFCVVPPQEGNREKFRLYRLSRFVEVDIIKKGLHRHITLDEINHMLEDSYGIFQGHHTEECVIHFTSQGARFAKGQIWHPHQIITPTGEDGSFDMRLPVKNHTELISEVLRFKGEAIPLSPPSFVQDYEKAVEAILSSLHKNA